jgi:hypothetical protein
MGEV